MSEEENVQHVIPQWLLAETFGAVLERFALQNVTPYPGKKLSPLVLTRTDEFDHLFNLLKEYGIWNRFRSVLIGDPRVFRGTITISSSGVPVAIRIVADADTIVLSHGGV